MSDPRTRELARLLVVYSAGIEPDDQVFIEAEVAAEPLVRALFEEILAAGAHPQLLLSLEGLSTSTGLDSTFLAHASEGQLAQTSPLVSYAYQSYDCRIKIHASKNTRHLANQLPEAIRKRRQALGSILSTQFERGRSGDLKWVTTLFPTAAYAQDAGMSLAEYEDFFYRACQIGQGEDPIQHWRDLEREQAKAIAAIEGGDRVHLKGPNCDLELSVEGRRFFNSCGRHNMPDGEIYTGPVEESANGWVRFTYPAHYQGRSVLGAELVFEHGRVVKATANRGEDFLHAVLDTDEGSRYLGEFAIGTNLGVDRFTGQILFDEKIGGSFHLALGAGYPETGSRNRSAIHWDLICDLRQDSEISVDGSLVYKDGGFEL